MKAQPSDYRLKNYPRARFSGGGVSSDRFILIAINRSIPNDMHIYQLHDGFKIKQVSPTIQPLIIYGYLTWTETFSVHKFLSNYKNYWKASKCLKKGYAVKFMYENIIVEGYPVGLTLTTDVKGHTSFTMTFYPSRPVKIDNVISEAGTKFDSIIHKKRDADARFLYNNIVFEQFRLINLTRNYTEKVQVTNRYGSIIGFGSNPVQYSLTIGAPRVMSTIVINKQIYTWEEAARLYLERIFHLKLIRFVYNEIRVSCYILSPTETIHVSDNENEIKLDLLVQGEG